MADELDKLILASGGRRKANGDMESYAPAIVAQVASAAQPIGAGENPLVYGQPGSKAFGQVAGYNVADRRNDLTESRDAFHQEHTKQQDTLAQLKEVDDHTTKALEATKTRIALQNQINQKLDTADFLRKFSAVDHTDPNYEEKVGVLAALHPLAGNDDAVKEMLKTKHDARNIYTDVMKTGGVNQFDGPARDAYMAVAKQTGGDIVQAHAAAKRVETAHNQLLKDRGEGYITADDIPAWDPTSGQARPDAYNSDGSLNYTHLRDVATSRQGERAGKIAQADNSDEKRDLALIEKLSDNPATRGDRDHPVKSLYLAAVARQNARDAERAKSAGTPDASATGGSAVKRYTDGF